MGRKKTCSNHEVSLRAMRGTLGITALVPVGVYRRHINEFSSKLGRNPILMKFDQKDEKGNKWREVEFVVDRDKKKDFNGLIKRYPGIKILGTTETLSILMTMPLRLYVEFALSFKEKFGRHAVVKRRIYGKDRGDDKIHEIEFVIDLDQELDFDEFSNHYFFKEK